MSEQRRRRALRERILLLHSNVQSRVYKVLGASGNEYTVNTRTEGAETCTCPDYVHRNAQCKHIFFVLMRVEQSMLVRPSDLFHGDEENDDRSDDVFIIDVDTVAADPTTTGRRKPIQDHDADCCICMESMDPHLDEIQWCRRVCGTNFHAVCLQRYFRASSSTKCPMCRSKIIT